jgi:hypothetical protein
MAIVTEGNSTDRQLVPSQNVQLLTRLNAPDPYASVLCSADNASLREGS